MKPLNLDQLRAMTTEQLKVLAYDEIARINNAQTLLNILNELINKEKPLSEDK